MTDPQQRQLDTRALEIAAELRGSVNAMNETLRSHLDDCLEERRSATKQRHDMRAEISLSFQHVTAKLEELHKQNVGSISRLHNRINAAGVAVILLLVSICGFLFAKSQGW